MLRLHNVEIDNKIDYYTKLYDYRREFIFLMHLLLKINGSELQCKTAIFSLSAFFRAYVGVNADPAFAKLLDPSALCG